MLTTTFRGLLRRRRRLGLTIASVALGVAFLSGTLVLRDTMDAALNDLVGHLNADVDAHVRGTALFEANTGAVRHRLDESVADAVADVESVVAAEAYLVLAEDTTLLNGTGEPVGGRGGAAELDSWMSDERLCPKDLTVGRGPETDDEIALSESAAELGGYRLGERVRLVTPAGKADYVLVGIYKAVGRDAVVASVALAEAQRISGAPGQVDVVLARARDGVSQEDLVARIAPLLANDAEVLTGTQASDEQAESARQQLGFVPDLLMLFAAIALGVGAFIIHNTFSILVVQRSRELALLRALGASRSQVLGSVVGEAGVIGLISAGAGLALGVALARGLQALLGTVGINLSGHSPVLGAGTVWTALAAGLTVTALSALPSAWRATRVPPVAALRNLAHDAISPSKLRAGVALALLVGVVASAVPALAADSGTGGLPLAALAVLLAVVAAIVAGPFLVRGLAAALRGPFARIAGIAGTLAVGNVSRSPERSAAAASALLVGVALVSSVTVLAASMEASIGRDVGRSFRGDLVVRNGVAGSIPTELADQLESVEGVRTVTRLRRAAVQVTLSHGTTSTERIAAADPGAMYDVVDPRMVAGSLPELTDAGIMIDRQVAAEQDLSLGDPVSLRFQTGTQATLVVEAISDDVLFAGNWFVTLDAFVPDNAQQLDYQLPLRLDDGAVLPDVRDRIEAAVDAYPTLELLDADEYVAANASQVTEFLNMLYVLLALSAFIAILGITNTLSLSIQERTRELGLLRAVGTTRAQLRSTLRWEATLITLVGTGLGLGLGIGASYVLVQVLASQGLSEYALPVAPLMAILALFAGLGVVASAPPASRAAGVEILTAIHSD